MQKSNKKQVKTATKQKILLILFSVFLTLLILEIGLRIGGFVISSYQRISNKEGSDVDYRILCLGESTTAMGGEYSWPEQLEVILNNRSSKIKFKVFNEGISGTNTAFILSRLDNNLKKYKPNMVITMMGVNDNGLIKYEENLKSHIPLILGDLRIYKLYNIVFEAWKNKTSRSNIIVDDDFFDKGQDYLSKGDLIKAEKMFIMSLKINKNNYKTYNLLSEIYLNQDKLKDVEKVLKESIKINPNNDVAYNRLAEVYYLMNISGKRLEKILTIKKILCLK